MPTRFRAFSLNFFFASLPGYRSGTTTIGTGIADAHEIPSKFAMQQDYLNPFSPTTTISIDLSESEHVRLVVFNALDRRVATLVDEVVPAGRYRILFDAADVPSGCYLTRMRAGSFEQPRSITVMR